MKITILDDYQGVAKTLRCFSALAGHDVTVLHEPLGDLHALPAGLRDAEVLVPLRERTAIGEALLSRLPRLRLISQSGPIPHIDLEACTRHGVTVCSGGGPHASGSHELGAASQATAELTWGLILAASRHIPAEVAALKQGRWQTRIGRSLRGLTLGILGYGQIGSAVAGFGKAFGMRVIAGGREGSLARARAAGHGTASSREAFFAEADVLSLHLRLTPETRANVTAADFALMKPTSLFVNTSRAGLVAPGALEAALRAGRPGAAALDVFDSEPVIDCADPLLALDNTVCTPHLGYVELASYEQLYARAFAQVQAFVAGSPTDIRNPAVVEQAARRRPGP